MTIPQEFDDAMERQRAIEKKQLTYDEADEKLSNMCHSDIVRSWLYYHNIYYELTM